MSSHTRPERDLRPLSLRYSSPQRTAHFQTPAEGQVLSQVYSTPYALHRASPHRLEKTPLIKVFYYLFIFRHFIYRASVYRTNST